MLWPRPREIRGSKGVRGRNVDAQRILFDCSLAILGLTAALGGQRAQADVAPTQPVALSVLGLDFVDTSGEPTDQTAAHQRAADFVSALQRDLVANGQYRVVPMSCGSAPCEPVMNPAELQKAARADGTRFVVLGGVHKMSTLVQWAKIQVADEEQGGSFLIGC